MTVLLKNHWIIFINIAVILNSTNTWCQHSGTGRVRSARKSPILRQKTNKQTKKKKKKSLNEIYSWDAKQKRYNSKKKKGKTKHLYMWLCHMSLSSLWQCMEIGLIDSSVNIAEEQRSALKPNCTAKTYEWSEEER